MFFSHYISPLSIKEKHLIFLFKMRLVTPAIIDESIPPLKLRATGERLNVVFLLYFYL